MIFEQFLDEHFHKDGNLWYKRLIDDTRPVTIRVIRTGKGWYVALWDGSDEVVLFEGEHYGVERMKMLIEVIVGSKFENDVVVDKVDKYELLDRLQCATKDNIVGLLEQLKELQANDILEVVDRLCRDKSTLLSKYSDGKKRVSTKRFGSKKYFIFCKSTANSDKFAKRFLFTEPYTNVERYINHLIKLFK